MKNLNEKGRFYQYEDSFVWILNSNIGLFTYNVDNPVYPLLASKERKLFKLFLCDTGFFCHYLYNDNVIRILNNESYNINKSYILCLCNIESINNKTYLPIYMIMFFKNNSIKLAK